jgi:hypothetical protein
VNAEGWYVDPYGLHEARWFSNGEATALVRDGEMESQDPAPDRPPEGQLERVAESAPADGADLLRADSAESQPGGAESGQEVVFDAFGEASGGD